MTNPTSTNQWGTYLDIVEVADYLQFSGVPAGGSQTILQRVIDSCCTRAQNMAGRPFAPTRFNERHDGWSGEYIQLHYSPFLELVTCTEWQSSGGPITLPESTPENPVEGIQIDYGTSQIMRTFAGYSWPRPFFPGSRNIEVTYIAGFDPIPPDVWEATMDLVSWRWRNSQQASASVPAPAPAGYGGYSPPAPSGLWPGVPNRIEEVFASYRLPSIG